MVSEDEVRERQFNDPRNAERFRSGVALLRDV